MDPPFRVYTFKMLAKLVYEFAIFEEKASILKKEDFLIFNEVY